MESGRLTEEEERILNLADKELSRNDIDGFLSTMEYYSSIKKVNKKGRFRSFLISIIDALCEDG